MALHNFSDLTRQTAFMRLWYSRLASISGQQMLMVAVGWQMYELTGSAWDLGLVGLFQFLPALLLTLVAGHVADRLHRARIVLVCLLVQGLVALVLMAATEGLFAVGPGPRVNCCWACRWPWAQRGPFKCRPSRP